MKKLKTAIGTEITKAIRSKVFWGTIILFLFIPMMLAVSIYVARHPEMTEKLGLVGTKAQMFGQNDWQGYLKLMLQTVTSLGFIAFGFICSWIFGREYSDRTLKDLLALPVPRSAFVNAKFIIAAFWGLFLLIVLLGSGLAMGFMMNLPGYSDAIVNEFIIRYFSTILLTITLITPVAWITGLSRGIFAPLAFVIFTMILSEFTIFMGLGPFIPWAVPGVHAMSGNETGLEPAMTSYFILGITSLLGYLLTLRHWRYSDHH